MESYSRLGSPYSRTNSVKVSFQTYTFFVAAGFPWAGGPRELGEDAALAVSVSVLRFWTMCRTLIR